MNGYKIVLLKAIFMLYKLPEDERVCSGICMPPEYMHADITKDSPASEIFIEKKPQL